jgi:hypothetical protein
MELEALCVVLLKDTANKEFWTFHQSSNEKQHEIIDFAF